MDGNVEDVARDLFRRLGRADLRGALRLFADDVLVDAAALPDVGRLRGRSGVKALIHRFTGTWDDYEMDIEEVRREGDGAVVVLHERGRGRGAGVPLDWYSAHLVEAGERGITLWRTFPDARDAPGASGLG